jgi:uncharacterized protein with von Willebrand factor type A (vWA) domain
MEDFFRALRAADVRVTPAEAIDAHLTVACVGYADRELLRDALCATLAKSEDEVDRFEATFDTFFARDAFQIPPPEEGSSVGEAGADSTAPEVAESPLAQMLLEGDASGLAQAMEAAAERARARIRWSR